MAVDILDIRESDPRTIIAEIDKNIRPQIENFGSEDVPKIVFYLHSLRHAYSSFGLDFPISEPKQMNYNDAVMIYNASKREIDKLKIDILSEKRQRESAVLLDETWRGKIHSYLENIRHIVERTEMDVALRDRILDKLNKLAAEVDRNRAPLQKFTDTWVELCEGISQGADALAPAAKLFERIVGAIVRLGTAGKPQLLLPKPEDFGLGEPPKIPPPQSK
jgi:hypothetical protein